METWKDTIIFSYPCWRIGKKSEIVYKMEIIIRKSEVVIQKVSREKEAIIFKKMK